MKHLRLGANIKEFYDTSGVYDVFLICVKHGHIMYSAAKEKDLGENIGHGKYKDSGLGDLWSKVVNSGKPSIVDMAPYAPSNGDPALFAGYPINDASGSLTGIIACSISNPINAITTGMSEGANQVASASGQVSSSSQSMAEGASEQAASIEETSSSMEEMSSMTKKNAENTNHSDNLMKEANQVIKAADEVRNLAITEMDNVVQQNAANAEESASASEER